MKTCAWILVTFLALAACGSAPPEPPPAPVRATVLFLNDIHGHLRPFTARLEDGTRAEVGGLARVATLVARIRAEDEARGARTLLVIAGDMLQGTPMSTVFRGRADVEVYEAVGVDAMTVGNHEFDFGFENFLELRKRAPFPFLSANVVWRETGELVCDGTATFPLADGVDLTVVGVTTRDLLTTTKPSNVAAVDVIDPVAAVSKAYERAKARGPVLLLSHSKAATDEAIARAVPGLVAIVGGHDQILLNPRKDVGPVPVFQAFEKGRYVGVLRLEVTGGKARVADWSYVAVTAEVEADPGIAAIIESYRSRLDASFKEEIGEAAVFLDGERERIRWEETTLGNFVADVMREHTGADLALLNAGSLRSSIDLGPVTVEDVFKAMPYENELVTVPLTGREVLEALVRGCRGARGEEDGGFLHVSGLRFTIRDRTPEHVEVDGAPLDPARTYTVAITDFLASGGDGYLLFTTKPARRTGSPLRELLVETIRSRGTIRAEKEGRIVRAED